VPLTVSRVAPEELLGGSRAVPAAAPTTDATATRTLTKGEPVAASTGRADDFSWPRGSVNVEPATPEPGAPDPNAPDAKSTKPGQKTSAADGGEAAPPAAEQKRRPRPRQTANPWQQRQQNPFFGFFR
jgi:hypothetical protein